MSDSKNPISKLARWQQILIFSVIFFIIFFAGNFIESLIKAKFGSQSSNNSAELQSESQALEASSTYYYSLKDGFSYGYEKAVSESDQSAGVGTSPLMLFKYSGQRDGLHQVYMKDDLLNVISVFECKSQCEFIKVTTLVMGVDKPKVDYLRFTPGTIAWSVMSDAINGHLEKVVVDKNGQKNNIWIGEDGNLYQTAI